MAMMVLDGFYHQRRDARTEWETLLILNSAPLLSANIKDLLCGADVPANAFSSGMAIATFTIDS